jgi:hypothetical protein
MVERSSVVAYLVVLLLAPLAAAAPPRPIRSWWGAGSVPAYVGAPHAPLPAVGDPPPQHPWMAAHGGNNMHADSYASDAHLAVGPLGRAPVVASAAFAAVGGECAGLVFDRRGRLVTVCGGFSGFTLRLLAPRTLEVLAALALPPRPSTGHALFTFDLQKIFTDTSGGAYFYLDREDRVVLVDAAQRLRVIAIDDTAGVPRFVDVVAFPLEAYLGERDCFSLARNPFPRGRCDAVTAVLPDWDGHYWWVSRFGLVGTVDPATGAVRTHRLEDEEIQNSFAVARDGVYVVSDRAMYGLRRGADGTPEVVWREPYVRAAAGRAGQINLGSGTTPTLLGDDLVAITDAADPVNVLFIRRDSGVSGPRTLCRQPVFARRTSATDNSLVGWGRSVVVENNHGYRNFTTGLLGGRPTGGLARVDLRADRSGCDVVWTSAEVSPSTVPKLSVGAGLVYVYTKETAPRWVDAWYVTAIDFHTGRTAWKRLTGTGWNFDVSWAPMTVGPDGTLYAGVFNGLVAVRDGE